MKPKQHLEPILSKQNKVHSPLYFLVIKHYKVPSFSLRFLKSHDTNCFSLMPSGVHYYCGHLIYCYSLKNYFNSLL